MSEDAAAPPSTAAAPAPALAPKRILSLRLDDGTLIRHESDGAKTVVLKTEEAWKAGLLKENHLLRLQAILCEQHSKLPEEAPPKSISTGSKRSSDSVVEVGTPAARRSCASGLPRPRCACASPSPLIFTRIGGAVWFRPAWPLQAPALPQREWLRQWHRCL